MPRSYLDGCWHSTLLEVVVVVTLPHREPLENQSLGAPPTSADTSMHELLMLSQLTLNAEAVVEISVQHSQT